MRKRAQKVVALLQGSKQADSSNFKSAMQWIIEEEGIGRVKRRRAYVTAFRGASFAIKKSSDALCDLSTPLRDEQIQSQLLDSEPRPLPPHADGQPFQVPRWWADVTIHDVAQCARPATLGLYDESY